MFLLLLLLLAMVVKVRARCRATTCWWRPANRRHTLYLDVDGEVKTHTHMQPAIPLCGYLAIGETATHQPTTLVARINTRARMHSRTSTWPILARRRPRRRLDMVIARTKTPTLRTDESGRCKTVGHFLIDVGQPPAAIRSARNRQPTQCCCCCCCYRPNARCCRHTLKRPLNRLIEKVCTAAGAAC